MRGAILIDSIALTPSTRPRSPELALLVKMKEVELICLIYDGGKQSLREEGIASDMALSMV